MKRRPLYPRIKGSKDNEPYLRLRKPLARPGISFGRGNKYSSKERKRIRAQLKQIRETEDIED